MTVAIKHTADFCRCWRVLNDRTKPQGGGFLCSIGVDNHGGMNCIEAYSKSTMLRHIKYDLLNLQSRQTLSDSCQAPPIRVDLSTEVCPTLSRYNRVSILELNAP